MRSSRACPWGAWPSPTTSRVPRSFASDDAGFVTGQNLWPSTAAAHSLTEVGVAGRLQDKVAFVSGGSSGIGAATALSLRGRGATVVICGRRREPLDEVVARIQAAGARPRPSSPTPVKRPNT